MIELMPESRDGLVAIRASGKLTKAEHDQILIPELEARLRRYGTLDILFYMDDGFDGWDLEAAWEDTTYALGHRADFNRVAVVGGPAWVELCIKWTGFLLKGDIRVFPGDRLDQAFEWIRS